MKPTFALNLSNESVGLLHRTPRGWLHVGDTSFSDPDLSDALGYLRSAALGLSPRGMTCKLVIPNAQILYLEIEAPGPDAASRRRQIKAALKEHTQVPVEDLVFDWSGKGKTVQVAAVERVTLEEAEAFAVENRFNPVSFVAIPEAASFKGEPWFGATKVASSILAPGEKVERDGEAIVITPRDLPRAEPVIAEPAPAEAKPTAADLPAEPVVAPEPPMPAPEIAPAAPPEIVPEPAPLPEPAPVPEIEPAFDPVPEPDLPPEMAVAAASFVAPKPAAKPAASFPPPSPTPAPTPTPPVAAPEPRIAAPDEAPMALDVPGVTDNTLPDDLPPPPSQAAMAAFASRRTGGDATLQRPLASPALGKPPSLGAAGSKTPVERPAMARPVPRMPAEGLAGRNDAAPRPVVAAPKSVPRPEAAKPDPASRTLKGLGALVTATTIPGGRKPKAEAAVPTPIPATPVPQTPAPPPLQSTKPVTKAASNAFGSKPMPTRGKPRYLGLILTGLLLLFLALIAAWSKFYLASAVQPEPTAVASADTAAPPAPSATELQEMSDAEAEADGQDIAPATPDAAATETAAADTAGQDPAAALPATQAAEPAPDTVVGTEAATVASPSADNQDEIFLAAMDAPPATVDPVALTAPTARGDPLPAAQLPPPPFGTVYQFDADGNIRPTPEGIITPEGVRLVSGPPAKLPPQRPAAIEAAAAAPQPAAPEAASPSGAVDTFEAIPALAGARPRLRPEGFAPAQQGEADPSLALPSDSRFASLRPKERPAAIATAAEEARLASASASLANPAASPLAVAVSLVPAQRPKDMSRAVEAAVAVAARLPDPAAEPEPEPVALAQPAPEPEPAPAKPVEPEAEAEPDVAANDNAPQSGGTVAAKATFANAINLGKINLIGVYGTPAKRYALIRLASGRYKKVKVGDSVDGGKIAAISATEVKYQKGSKLQTLGMPKGTD